MRTPDFVLNESHYQSGGTSQKNIELPAMAFVRPLELHYVPKEIRELEIHKFFDPERDVFCFCRYGIISIPRYKIREVK